MEGSDEEGVDRQGHSPPFGGRVPNPHYNNQINILLIHANNLLRDLRYSRRRSKRASGIVVDPQRSKLIRTKSPRTPRAHRLLVLSLLGFPSSLDCFNLLGRFSELNLGLDHRLDRRSDLLEVLLEELLSAGILAVVAQEPILKMA